MNTETETNNSAYQGPQQRIQELEDGLRRLRKVLVTSGAWDEHSWADRLVRELLREPMS